MTEKLELYKCNVCGNVVEILISGVGTLVCCGQQMELIESKNSKSDEMLNEKHSPTIEKISDDKYEIRVVKHPMENEHYIMFVQCISEDKNEAQIKYFYPQQEVKMVTNILSNNLSARSYCNVHGLYLSKNEGEV